MHRLINSVVFMSCSIAVLRQGQQDKPMRMTMTTLALRDHATQILMAIAKDMRSRQTEVERYVKSQGLAEITEGASETSAATHGVLRQLVGFDLVQLAAEYRAVRATVLRLWSKELVTADATALEDVARFNEGVDQALAESIASYSDRVANSRDTFLAILGHDLRSPLSTIASSLYVLSNGPARRAAALAHAVNVSAQCRFDAPNDHRPVGVHPYSARTRDRGRAGVGRFLGSLPRSA